MIKLKSLSGRCPFSSVWQAAVVLNCPSRQVHQHIHAGRLPLTFDIGLSNGERPCLRLATASVVALRRRVSPPADLDGFLAEVLPATQFSYKAPQLAHLWQCHADHIYHLIEANLLEDAGGATHYRVPRESVTRFLMARRVC